MDQTDTTARTSQQLSAVLADLADLLDAIEPEQADSPTPCTEFSVADLREHVIGWLTAFADGYSAADGLCSDEKGVLVQGNGADQVRAARAKLDDALPEAAQRELFIGEAGVPGGLALSMILWEYQVHGWDLARAAGLPWSPAEDGLVETLEFAPAMLTPEYQGEGKSIGPSILVRADAPPLDQLVGLSGRDPGWSAAN